MLASTVEISEGVATIRRETLIHPISEFFSSRLFSLIERIFNRLSEVQWAKSSCLAYVQGRRCFDEDACKRDHISSDFKERFDRRLAFWVNVLHLSQQLHWLGNRLSAREHEYGVCNRYRRLVLDAFV